MGISIGVTRLYYVLGEQGLLTPNLPTAPADVLILPMSENMAPAVALATTLRNEGIRTQLYTEQKKFKQKMSYADKLGVPYVIFLGDDEIQSNTAACKDMATGKQKSLPMDEVAAFLKAGVAEKTAGSVILEKQK